MVFITVKKLVILPEYSAILTPMTPEEYEGLKLSIKERGQLLPIIINQDGVILDGHNRYQICQELGIVPITESRNLSKKEEIQYVRTVNISRRQLNPFALVILACKEHNSEWKLGDKVKFSQNETETAMRYAVSKGMWHRAWQTIENNPELISKVLEGKMSYNEAYQIGVRNKRNAARSEALALAPPANAKLYLLDFDVAPIEEGSIDAIVVDPPYGKKYLDKCVMLAKKARIWLRPRGSLMVMVGQYYLPEFFEKLMIDGLNYYWIVAYHMSGGTAFERSKPMQNAWKPIIWLTKGEIKFTPEEVRTGTLRFPMGSDMVHSKKAEKSGSPGRDKKQTEFDSSWQQSTSGFEALILKCTKPGDMVLDPMMGIGTTGVAAINLKRKFIGMDIDPVAFKEANGRIKEAEKEMEK
jgi:DNA modification methylase